MFFKQVDTEHGNINIYIKERAWKTCPCIIFSFRIIIQNYMIICFREKRSERKREWLYANNIIEWSKERNSLNMTEMHKKVTGFWNENAQFNRYKIKTLFYLSKNKTPIGQEERWYKKINHWKRILVFLHILQVSTLNPRVENI